DRARGDPLDRRLPRDSAVVARARARNAENACVPPDARGCRARAHRRDAERDGMGPRGPPRRGTAPRHQSQHPAVPHEEAGHRAAAAAGLTGGKYGENDDRVANVRPSRTASITVVVDQNVTLTPQRTTPL